jgi:threonine/homoserine/homoserine lactone efflux protein
MKGAVRYGLPSHQLGSTALLSFKRFLFLRESMVMELLFHQMLLPVMVFAFSASITPGPNNLMLAASGVNFGFRRTIPHMLGVAIGFPVMVLAVGFGLSEVFHVFPLLHQVLKVVGIAYLLWLAWKIAIATAPENGGAGRPFTFLQAAGFQWVNPKAWIMAVGSIATYTTMNGAIAEEVLVITAVFGLVSFPCVVVWVLFGTAIGRVIVARRRWLKVFNIAMALMIVVSILSFVL